MTLDALGAVRKLRESGADEALAEGIVEVVSEATGELLTRAYFDAQRAAERAHYDAMRAADREHYDAMHAADREHYDTMRTADRERLDAQRAADREYLDARFTGERHHVDERFEALRAEMYRALAIQGGIILGGMGVILALVESL
ncbi:MAG: hypothetical protein OXE43_09525 [Chloroflexi bacterium]|nr:hypothetical protein [Chloroflexota bacterium]